MMAGLRCVLAWVLNIPIPRRKTEFGPCIQWIGWPFHVIAGYISLPQNKIDHIAEYISTMQNSSKTFKKFFGEPGEFAQLDSAKFLIDAMLVYDPLLRPLQYPCQPLQHQSWSLDSYH